ncbi:MAG: hypothetical protein ACTSVI_17415 [Promethearchaeota archaeon]
MPGKDIKDLLKVFSTPSSNENNAKNGLEGRLAGNGNEAWLSFSRDGEKLASKEKDDDGVLGDFLSSLNQDERFDFLMKLLDFTGDILVKTIDHFDVEFLKIENAITLFQTKSLEQITAISNKIADARAKGLLKEKKVVSKISSALSRVVSQANTPQTKKERTPEELNMLAREIRNLLMRQKEKRSQKQESVKIQEPKIGIKQGKTISEKVKLYQESLNAQEGRIKRRIEKVEKIENVVDNETRPLREKSNAQSPATRPPEEEIKLPENFKKFLVKNIKKKIKDDKKDND